MRSKLAAALIAALALCGLSGVGTADALTCVGKPIGEDYGRSDVVFRGTAIGSFGNREAWTVHFIVKSIWKGDAGDVSDGVDMGSLWRPVKPGEDYLVLASYRDGRLASNLCGNSREWDSDTERMMAPFEGDRTDVEPSTDRRSAAGTSDVPVVIAVAFLAAAAYRAYARKQSTTGRNRPRRGG